MSKWRFTKEKELPLEKAFGRDHYWHYSPDIDKSAKSCFVKVLMKKGDGHHFHRHPEMHEILYFLKGTAEQWIEDEKQFLGPGDSVYIDPDVVHATFNAGDSDLEFLAILAPSEGWEAGTIDMSKEEPYNSLKT